MNKKVNVSVINDLVSDRRVFKHCKTLSELGYNVHLIGRKFPNSPKMYDADFSYKRFKLLFTKGALFYFFFNIRLFFYLIKHKSDILFANDLDTLLANYLASKYHKIPLVYDSHELFTEVPELKGRYSRRVWLIIEKWIFPKLKYIITVNESIANIYSEKYTKEISVIRNLPFKLKSGFIKKSKHDLGLDENRKYIILQGAGINVQRGAEELVKAMRYVKSADLLIIGSGDVFEYLKEIMFYEGLEDKVHIFNRMDYEKLMQYTSICELGLSLDKDTNLNYRYSLPNKLFDYIQAGIPVLISNLPEVRKIVESYEIGDFICNHNPISIASKIEEMIKFDIKSKVQQNLKKASEELIWDKEKQVLIDIFNEIDG